MGSDFVSGDTMVCMVSKDESKSQLGTSLNIAVTPEFLSRRIFMARGQKVMLDSDLAELYRVETKVLNQAVRRNQNRFPKDFMFKLSLNEVTTLRSQFVTSNVGRGGRRHIPYAFTELGVAMLSSVLKSDRAVQMNIHIMRAFVKLRELLATHRELAEKVGELEKGQKEHMRSLIAISAAVNELIEANRPKKDVVGFAMCEVVTDKNGPACAEPFRRLANYHF